MQTPELLLQDLNAALRRLCGATHLLAESSLSNELKPVMRRLLVAEVFGATSIIAIGGSQGAGKTTLLRTIYDMNGEDAQWLHPNEGRGEKMPVLVLEEAGRKQVQGAIRCLKRGEGQNYQVVDEDVDAKVFQMAVSDPTPDELLPVLKVPQRFFSRPCQAWMLLPGYEKQDNDWQALMRQGLVAAAGCIIVTDETRMANKQQIDIVNDMMANELSHAQSLVVVSKTEGLRNHAERLNELRSTAQRVFGIAADQTSRIVFTGSDNADYVKEWQPILEKAIKSLTVSSGGNRQAQLARLEDVLTHDLGTLLNRISNKTDLFFHQKTGGEGGPKETVKSFLEAFNDARNSLRDKYQEEINKELNVHCELAWKNLQNWLVDNQEGWGNQIQEKFRGATESAQRIESQLSESWNSSGSILDRYTIALTRVTMKANIEPKKLIDVCVQNQLTVLQRMGYIDSQGKPIEWMESQEQDQHNRNLRILLNPKLNELGQLGKNCKRSIKLLPALTLEFSRLASLMPALVGGVESKSLNPLSQSDRENLINASVDQLGQGVDIGKTLLRSIATVLAVDVGTDGDVDVIPALKAAMGAGTAAATSGTAGAASAAGIGGPVVVGLVAVGYLACAALEGARRYDEKSRVMAHQMLMNIKDHHQQHFIRYFDELMNLTRERLLQSLHDRYHLDEHLMEQDRLTKAIADVSSLRRDLLDELGRSGRTTSLHNTDAEGALP
jgi:alpha-D-ribose 1-methylphosphonate 5-triphosphate synthase subunit PhnL